MVTVNNLSIAINNRTVLDNISCTLTAGSITLFIGKSGAGKTTLLKSLVGLIPNTQQNIMLNDMKLDTLTPKKRSEEIGYVFQEFNLFPNLTVLENCIDPLMVHGTHRAVATKKALALLQELGMATMIDKYPAELSGGQQQRVAIARCLSLNPRVLLFDEPTASLDPLNTEILIAILRRLAAQGLTIGISSQDMEFTRKVFDRIYYIDQGKIIEYCETPNVLNTCPIINKFIG